MLLNEFLKEHEKVEHLEAILQATTARQQSEIEILTAALQAQAAQIQKVGARLEASGRAPRVASNNDN